MNVNDAKARCAVSFQANNIKCNLLQYVKFIKSNYLVGWSISFIRREYYRTHVYQRLPFQE